MTLKLRDILKLNFEIRANDWFLAERCVKKEQKNELPYNEFTLAIVFLHASFKGL